MNATITPPVEQVVTIEMTVREAQVLRSYLAYLNWEHDERAATLDAFGGHFHKMAYSDVRNNILNSLRGFFA